MDEFLDDFARKKDQEIVDYNNDWFKEITKAEKVAGELTGKWKAHLYLKKMRINPMQKSQVLTGALGKFTVEALQKSAMVTFPSIKDAFRSSSSHTPSHGYQSRGNTRFGRKKHFAKSFGKKKGHGTHVLDNEDQDEDDGEDEEEEYTEEDNEVNHAGADDTSSNSSGRPEEVPDVPDVPVELAHAYEEANNFLARAKKQRAEIEKARGFFKQGASQSGKDAALKSLKGRLPCAKCGQLNHWYGDKICPTYNEPFKN